jgi:hypothetical protein
MTFDEQNTIENALRDHLSGMVDGEQERVSQGGEGPTAYGAAFRSPHVFIFGASGEITC